MILNATEYRDKVYGCMLGKNIGGTLGGPVEGQTGPFDLTFYTTPKGAPLPNDDLDLQLVWLKCLEERGPIVDAATLGEYWLSYVWPPWNEYGIGKANMRRGFVPPVSGDADNLKWRHSNGAWIRSEIWACLAPGSPSLAAHLAYQDAVVDHGTGEGVYAELFTAAIESAAFVESDRMKLIDIGLSMIPPRSYTARCIRAVISCWRKGRSWLEARQAALDVSKPLGIFMAPQNVAFVVVGILYGEGNFGKTICTAVNCGDDTDCTGATSGSIMGILMGESGIPKDWKEYIGNRIKTVAVANFEAPRTLDELTDRTVRMCPRVLGAYGADVKISDDRPTDTSDVSLKYLKDNRAIRPLWSAPAYEILRDFVSYKVRVAYSGEPVVKPRAKCRVTVEVQKSMPGPFVLNLRWRVPRGWKVRPAEEKLEFALKAGEVLKRKFTITAASSEGSGRCLLEVVPEDRLTAGLIQVPVIVLKERPKQPEGVVTV